MCSQFFKEWAEILDVVQMNKVQVLGNIGVILSFMFKKPFL